MKKYPWATNQEKLQRAIGNSRGLPLAETEARIKQLYVSYGGKLVELEDSNEDTHMTEEETVETPTTEEGAPGEETTPETPTEEGATGTTDDVAT